jgi:hypothetical protein
MEETYECDEGRSQPHGRSALTAAAVSVPDRFGRQLERTLRFFAADARW